MINKYTSLLQKYLKILIFTTLLLSLFVGFGMLFRTSQTIESHASRDPNVHKAAFFEAMQEHDINKGRMALAELKKILLPQDPFLVEIAPAYLADLYIQYAKVLAYDKDASETMLTQAALLAPHHPEVLALLPVPASKTEQIELEKTEPEQIVAVAQPVILSSEPEAPEADLPPLVELVEEIKDGPPRVPYLDPPPLAGYTPEPEYELIDAPVIAQPDPIVSNDPCALSYLTKANALTPCIDPVAANRFGPAMFVVGEGERIPLLAFTQQPITRSDYEVFCAETGQCQESAEVTQSTATLIDLTDVEETIHDYNAYCQMAGTCTKLESQTAKVLAPLTRSQAQRYALWLSKKTGYQYRHATPEDSQKIQQYFTQCVQAQSCAPGILNSVSALLEQSDTVLIREVKG
jgi:hypothetical protein